jgi:hypothetical protein
MAYFKITIISAVGGLIFTLPNAQTATNAGDRSNSTSWSSTEPACADATAIIARQLRHRMRAGSWKLVSRLTS